MLLPLLDPAHGAPDQAGQEGDQQVLGVDVSLGAEATADIERHAADARLRKLEEPGGRPANRMHHLRCRPDRDGIGALVVGRDHAAALDGNAGIAMGVEATAKPVGRGGERGRHRAFLDGKLADQVGRVLFVEDLRPGRQRRLDIDDGRQRLDVDSDQLGGIQGLIAALGHDHRDRLADMADLAHGQHRLLRIVDGVLHVGSPLGRQRQLAAGDRGRQALQLLAGEHAHDARHRRRPADIDRADAAVRMLASDEDGVQHARQDEIGDELPAPRQQAMILAPRHGASDEAGRFFADHLLHLPWQSVAALRELCRWRCWAATATACCRAAPRHRRYLVGRFATQRRYGGALINACRRPSS